MGGIVSLMSRPCCGAVDEVFELDDHAVAPNTFEMDATMPDPEMERYLRNVRSAAPQTPSDTHFNAAIERRGAKWNIDHDLLRIQTGQPGELPSSSALPNLELTPGSPITPDSLITAGLERGTLSVNPYRTQGRRGLDATSSTASTSELSGGTSRSSNLQSRMAALKGEIDTLDAKGDHLSGEEHEDYERMVQKARNQFSLMEQALEDLQNSSGVTVG